MLRPTFYDKKLTEAQRQILSPSLENQTAFSKFLSEANTGLFRLLPAGAYEFGRTIAADRPPDAVIPLLGGGAYYSFTERTHKFGPWSDIRLEGNRLTASPTRKAVGIITVVGDVALESVDTDTPGIRLIATLVPPKTYSDLARLHLRTLKGFEASGFAYGSVITTTPNVTYAMRSISFQKDGCLVRPNDPYTRIDPSRLGYDGSDVLIAFRILRRDEDGSLEILWKRLQRYQNPKIKGEPRAYSVSSLKELIEREIPRGASVEAVIAFLDLNGVSHSNYVEAFHDENAAAGTTGLVSAIIFGIERRSRATYDLQLLFYFNDRRELIECGLKQVRH